ncbi:MAG: MFS transporter, partial [Acidobacteriota bacterium]
MKKPLDMSLRIKVFLIAVFFMVIGQVVYSRMNVAMFQESYVASLQDKCARMGAVLKGEVEYILRLGIPITKLVKMENTLREILQATPELEFIEITDGSGSVLYYADHEGVGRFEPGSRPSKNEPGRDDSWSLAHFGFAPRLEDATFPLFQKGGSAPAGFIRARLSATLIAGKSREIFLDMLTAILTSLLITFEFLTFFVAYTIADPLSRLVTSIRDSIGQSRALAGPSSRFMREMNIIAGRFNDFLDQYLSRLAPYLFVQEHVIKAGEGLQASFAKQSRMVGSLLARDWPANGTPGRGALERLQAELNDLPACVRAITARLNPASFSPAPEVAWADADEEDVVSSAIPYAYIRPVVFLFLMADGLCVSFLPMFVNSVSEPLWGLSKEIVIGLPISIYMLSFAISMPVSGAWADAVGCWRPLLIGIGLNAAGLILTSIAQNIFQLILFRSITAFGFGMVFIACQHFVMGNTTLKTRAMGMAAFLAAFFSGDLCGTVIGGMLADRIGYRAVFLTGGILSLGALLCTVWLFRKDFSKVLKSQTRMTLSPKDLFRVVRDRDFFSLLFLQAIPAKIVLVGFLYYFVPLYLRHLGTLQSDIGRILMVYGVVLAILGPLVSKVLTNERYQKYYVLSGGLLTGL